MKRKQTALHSAEDSGESEAYSCPSFDADESLVGRTWSSWAAFDTWIAEYQEETYQQLRLRTTTKVASRNGQRPEHLHYDTSLGDYYRKYICTHGWEYKDRGTGERTNHIVRGIGCDYTLAVALQRKKNEYWVRVTNHVTTHNHPTSEAVNLGYAELRRVTDPSHRQTAHNMHQGGAKKRKILWYLQQASGKVLLPKDVQNLVTETRQHTYTSPDENVRLAEVLNDFGEGAGNVTETFDDPSGLLSCVTIQSAHMRRMARLFPEVICVDSTFGTNINRQVGQDSERDLWT